MHRTTLSVILVAEMYVQSNLGSSPLAAANISVNWCKAKSLDAMSRDVAPRASRANCTLRSVLSIDSLRTFRAVVGSSRTALLTLCRFSSDTITSRLPSSLATPVAFSCSILSLLPRPTTATAAQKQPAE